MKKIALAAIFLSESHSQHLHQDWPKAAGRHTIPTASQAEKRFQDVPMEPFSDSFSPAFSWPSCRIRHEAPELPAISRL